MADPSTAFAEFLPQLASLLEEASELAQVLGRVLRSRCHYASRNSVTVLLDDQASMVRRRLDQDAQLHRLELQRNHKACARFHPKVKYPAFRRTPTDVCPKGSLSQKCEYSESATKSHVPFLCCEKGPGWRSQHCTFVANARGVADRRC